MTYSRPPTLVAIHVTGEQYKRHIIRHHSSRSYQIHMRAIDRVRRIVVRVDRLVRVYYEDVAVRQAYVPYHAAGEKNEIRKAVKKL